MECLLKLQMKNILVDYKITEQGKSFLAELRHEWNEFIGSVDKVVNPESPSTNVAKKQTKKSENQ